MDVFPRCVTSQVHSIACVKAAVGSAMLLRPFYGRSRPPVTTSTDFVVPGGSHVILLLDCVVTGVICTYACNATALQLLQM